MTGTYILQCNRSAFNQNEIEPTCLLCKTDIENTEHFLLCCPSLHSARQSILDIINGLYSSLHDPQLANHPRDLLQIVLDCSALYLTTPKRNHHIIETIEFHSRRLCYTLHGEHYTQIQTIRHNPRGLYYPGKSGDFHVTSFHFRVAKKRPQFNECVMNCNVLM